MAHIDNGGPAFPCMPPQDTAAGSAVGYPFPDQGMSMRDYFAAKWLQGYMANPSLDDIKREDAASQAYKMADAMLKARG